MFQYEKETFILAMMFFSCNLPSVNSLSCISMNNQECKTRPKLLMLMEMKLCFFYIVLK